MKQVSMEGRAKRDEFLRELKREWAHLWMERFDDKVRGEGVAVRDYPLILVERGAIIFASRDFKPLSFREIVEYWNLKGAVYAPDPSVGGWGKFIKTYLKSLAKKRAEQFKPKNKGAGQQPKKGGRGWLHIL